MRYKLTSLVFCAAALIAGHSASAQAGILDSDWDTDGIRIDSFGTGNDKAEKIKVLPDGKVLVAGYAKVQSDFDMVLLKYNTDGSPDMTFSGDGKATVDLGNLYNDYMMGMTLQPDGKILLCGITDSAGVPHNTMVTVRTNASGTRDAAFGSNGVVILPSAAQYGNARAIAADVATGRIAIAADLDDSLAVYVLNADGTPYTAFGSGGRVVITPAAGYDYLPVDIAWQPDGKIVTGGTYGIGTDVAFFVNRLNADGTADNSFSVDGMVTTKFTNTSSDRASAMLLQPDGRIAICGYDYDNNVSHYCIARYNTDGTLDQALAGTGKSMLGISGYQTLAASIAQASDGKYILCGYATDNVTARFAVMRVLADGTRDSTFGTNGATITSVGAVPYQTTASIQQAPDGRICIAGNMGPTASNTNIVTARYISGLHVGISDLHTTATAALIYPNPVQQTETLRYTLATDDKVSIALYSTDGKMVQEFITSQPRTSGENVETLSFSPTLPSGTYILRLSTAQGECNIKVTK